MDWREDLKKILREAGTYHRPVVFMLEDNQIRWETMVEDVNNLLNSGMVPNLYASDERAEIVEKMRPLASAQGLPKDISDAELCVAPAQPGCCGRRTLLCSPQRCLCLAGTTCSLHACARTCTWCCA